MSSFCAGCCRGRGGDEVEGRGEGVVSRDEPGEEAEEGETAEKVELTIKRVMIPVISIVFFVSRSVTSPSDNKSFGYCVVVLRAICGGLGGFRYLWNILENLVVVLRAI